MKNLTFVASGFVFSLLLLAGCGSAKTQPAITDTDTEILPGIEESKLLPLDYVNYDYNFGMTFPPQWTPLSTNPIETNVKFAEGITADRLVLNSQTNEERILNVYVLDKNLKGNPAVTARQANYLGENDTQVFFAEAAPEVDASELAKILATFKFVD